jgi:hypothetical protein
VVVNLGESAEEASDRSNRRAGDLGLFHAIKNPTCVGVLALESGPLLDIAHTYGWNERLQSSARFNMSGEKP